MNRMAFVNDVPSENEKSFVNESEVLSESKKKFSFSMNTLGLNMEETRSSWNPSGIIETDPKR